MIPGGYDPVAYDIQAYAECAYDLYTDSDCAAFFQQKLRFRLCAWTSERFTLRAWQ